MDLVVGRNKANKSPEVAKPEQRADDFEGIKSRFLPLIPDLEVEAEGHHTWSIENYRNLTGSQRGPTFKVGDQPWRILFWPYGNNVDHASCYLEQAFADKPPENWHCCAQFAIVMWNKHDPSIFVQLSATHRFDADEGDWGFTRFAELRKLLASRWDDTRHRPLIEGGAVNLTAYVRIYKDMTGVLWHNFRNYDSKKETGMVGLKNLGATSYLNTLLQSLFFVRAFRKAIYQIPTEGESRSNRGDTAWALQRLFYRLETSRVAVSANELTLSFGWDARQIFEAQDVFHMYQLLTERIESRMKGTEVENALPEMFAGKLKTNITCVNVPYAHSRIEDFWDIQLNVTGHINLDDSFKEYTKVEVMDGDYKYYTEEYGFQEAHKGVIFESFPSILHIQLKRYSYDIELGALVKVNDRFVFPETFDASPYLSKDADGSEPSIYQLYGVWVHAGDLNAGHNYAFLRPKIGGRFYKFDDARVTRATLKEAVEGNFGSDDPNLANRNLGLRGPSTRTQSIQKATSAYVLVYIRESRLGRIMEAMPADTAPSHITRQLAEEAAVIERERKEREEQRLNVTCVIANENIFKQHQGYDLASWEASTSEIAPEVYQIPKATTVKELCDRIAEENDLPRDHVRLWAMVNRQNNTLRPDQPLRDPAITIDEAFTRHGARKKSFRLWAEFSPVTEGGKPVWPPSQVDGGYNAPILIFLKYFDHHAQTLLGVGHIYLRRTNEVSDMLPLIRGIMGWTHEPIPTLALFEEIKPSLVEPVKVDMTLHKAEIQDGDIVCFQKTLTDQEIANLKQAGNCSSAKEFYKSLRK